MTNFLSFARSFSAMLMPFRSLLPPPSFEAPHLNRGSTGCRDTTRRRPVAFAPQDKPGAGSFRTDEHSKMRLVRTFLVLLPVAFILAGGAQSLEWGRFGSAAETHSMASDGEIDTYPEARLDETAHDRQMEDERSVFENVMTSACGAGDVYGCGLLLAWRTLLAMLQHLLETAVILVLIALGFRSFILTKVCETIEKRNRKTQAIARDSFIGPRLPMSGSDPSLVRRPKTQGDKPAD
jgi:hypothetical protein